MGKHIIEFLGPPGVGKSSLYNALCQQWHQDSNWIHQDALLAPPKPGMLDFTNWLAYTFQVLQGKKRAKSIPIEYGLRFADQHQELAGFYWDHLSDPVFFQDPALDKRFRWAYFLFSDFCRYQAIQQKPSNRPCVIDEGLLQKSFLLHEDEELMRHVMRRYLALVPLPYAIVYIDTPDQQILLDRLQKRKKKLPAHLEKNTQAVLAETGKWQRLLQTILELVKEQQVIICAVDGARPIPENVQRISGFLANLP
jgi:adenylate kinase family enzyme